jgi:hypothetical protein
MHIALHIHTIVTKGLDALRPNLCYVFGKVSAPLLISSRHKTSLEHSLIGAKRLRSVDQQE